MTLYADYEFYISHYGGTLLDEDGFNCYVGRASSYLNYYTDGQVAKHTELDEVQMACCALTEQYSVIDGANTAELNSVTQSMENGFLQSETVGNWTQSFRSGMSSATEAAEYKNEAKKELASIVRQYLYGTGLLYRGGHRK
jgi:hypothetical protein